MPAEWKTLAALLALGACAGRPPRQVADNPRFSDDAPDAATTPVDPPAPPPDPWQLNEGCDALPGSRRHATTADGAPIGNATCRVDLVLTDARVRSLCIAVTRGRVDIVASVQGAEAFPNVGYHRYGEEALRGPSCNTANCAGATQPGPEARVGAWFPVDLVLSSRRPIGMNQPPAAVAPFPQLHARVRFTSDGIEAETPEEGRVTGQCRDGV